MNKLGLPSVSSTEQVGYKSLKKNTNILMPQVMARLEAIVSNPLEKTNNVLTACAMIIKMHMQILEQERAKIFEDQQQELNDIRIKRARLETGEETETLVAKSGLKALEFKQPKNPS